MGVKGLWRLLLPIGRRISIETLEGRILAIDASIWLTQFLTVAARQREQDLLGDDGAIGGGGNSKAYSSDYLVGFLRRLCKLRYQGVRPVLVFDGETPEIKRREIQNRFRRRKRKLGDSFYLGDKNGDNFHTKEEEEMLEATRRMAKRILAKQLRTGQLVTTKMKQKVAKKQKTGKNTCESAKMNAKTDEKAKASVGTVAKASYAPGFYDPYVISTPGRQVAETMLSTKDPALKGSRVTDNSNCGSNNDDDDHLLRDDYNTNQLEEEVNDWDKPIVIDSDTEINPSDDRNESSRKYKSSSKPKKGYRGSAASKFHAGDGTDFKAESVADLPESARKDVIEDAQKQRRLASRREFMKVASDPDGLSSCQLRNFLKSTRLNRDIAEMAQAAKAKVEEEAKMALGNGIIFEKYDNDVMRSGGGSFASRKTSDSTASRMQHYRSVTYSNARIGGKRSNPGMMRMFHHKGQPKIVAANSIGDDNSDLDDEHDFRKTRNNHYLSNGIRLVNSDRGEDDDVQEYVHEEEYIKSSRNPKPHFEDSGSDGFIVAIMDGSDAKRKNTKLGTASTNTTFGGEIIEIDCSSESDVSDFEKDRKLCAAKPKRIDSKASQELQDEALARALQTIEDEEISGVVPDDNVAGECIEIDDSDDDNQPGGGFFPHSSSIGEQNLGDNHSQREKDDAKLARALQEAEYDKEEDQNDGVEVQTKSNEAKIDHNMIDGEGFFVTATEGSGESKDNFFYGGEGYTAPKKRDNDDVNEDSVNGIESLLSTKEDNDNEAQNTNNDGGLFLPNTEEIKGSSKSPSISLTSQLNDSVETDTNTALGATPLPMKECNLSPLKRSKPKTLCSIFAIGKQTKVSKKKFANLLVSHDSSGDEEEDVDWEDGNSENQLGKELKVEINDDCFMERKKSKSPKCDVTSEFQSDMVSGNISEELGDYKTQEGVDKYLQSKKGCAFELSESTDCNTVDDAAGQSPKNSEFTDINRNDVKENDEEGEDDDEVDWEDGDKEAEENKLAGPNVSAENKLKGKSWSESRKSSYSSNGFDRKEEKKETNGTPQKISSEQETVKASIRSALKSSGNDTAMVNSENVDDNTPDTKYGNNAIKLKNHGLLQLYDDTNRVIFKQTSDDGDAGDDDHDEVDWEDGDDGSHEGSTNIIHSCEVGEVPTEPLKKSATDSVHKDARQTNKNDEEKIMEGGKKRTISTSPTEVKERAHNQNQRVENSKYFAEGVRVRVLLKSETINLDEDLNADSSSECEAGKSEGRNVVVESDDWDRAKTQSSDEVAAALEHAQGTAANLTNWAGRAFRRAIAQHAIENGMEIPESAKPGVSKKTRRVVDQNELPHSGSKRNINRGQKSSRGNTVGRTRLLLNRTKSDDKIDNSSWLDTLDSARISTEDYTVASQETNPSDRLFDGASGGVTDEMRTEVMQLLRLFGVPYVAAPAEAEAQCVELERLGLVDGIITEDSDTFVFGGQVVYKNIFEDKKYVEVYHAKDAGEEMNLTQDSLVALAMLLGGDYTEGVKGVGIVNGMEVLQAFDIAQGCEAGLKRFRKWLDGFDPNDMTNHKNEKNGDCGFIRSEKEQSFHRKHHTARTRWIAPKQFPDAKVLNAYLNPVVDTSTERFSWGTPDLDGLIAFCRGHMGWVAEETEWLVAPIIKQIEGSSMRQTRIDSFMRYEDGIKFAKIQSKRLRQVLGLTSKGTTRSEKSRQQRFHKKPSAENNDTIQVGEAESSFSEPEKVESNAGSMSNADVMIQEDAVRGIWLSDGKEKKPEQTKKSNDRTRIRSLAALSSSSASTAVIASSSKIDNINGSATTTSYVLDSSLHRRCNMNNLPKKAPPVYQKQSSAILEERNDNSPEALDGTKTNTYEVTNPSIL